MEVLLKRNQNALIALTIFLISFGGYQLFNLPISLYPNISKPVVKVQIDFKDDVDNFIKDWGGKIETSLKNVKDVVLIEGEYRQGRVIYLVHFEWNKDNDDAIRDVGSTASFYQAQLPKDLPLIRVTYFNPGSENYIVVDSDKMSAEDLSKNIENELLPAINEIEGVARSWVSALGDEHVSIIIDPIKAIQYNFSVIEIIDIIKDQEYDFSLGSINTEKNGKFAVKIKKSNNNIMQLRRLPVGRFQNREIYLSDVAVVDMAQTKIVRMLQLDGKKAVAIAAWPKPGANLYSVSNEFLHKVRDYTKNIGTISILNDPAAFIGESIRTVLYAIGFGMLIASLSVLFFFNSLSKTIIVCIVMPLSLLGAGILMALSGVGINLLSLGAMSVSIGMVIDGTIIVVDNIDSHQRSKTNNKDVIYKAVAEVAPAIFASLFTTIVVFLPLAFTSALSSSLLKDIVFVIVSIITFSMIITLVLVPSLFSMLSLKHSVKKNNKASISLLDKLSKLYCWVLEKILSNYILKISIALIVLVLFYVSYSAFNEIKTELIAKPEAHIIDVSVSFKKDGLEIEDRSAIVNEVRKIIDSEIKTELKFTYSDIRENVGYISLHLKSFRNFSRVFDRLNKILKETNDYDINIDPWITSALNVPSYPDIRLFVTGDTEEIRRYRLSKLNEMFSSYSDVSKVKITPKYQKSTKYELTFNRMMISQLFNEEEQEVVKRELEEFVGLAIEGKYLADVELSGKQVVIIGQLGESTVNEIQEVGNLPYKFKNQIYNVRDLVDISSVEKWKIYYSRNGNPLYMAEVWLSADSSLSSLGLFEKFKLDNLESENIPYIVDNPKVEVNDAINSLIRAFSISIALVFLIVLFMFKDFTESLIICTAIPFAIVGAIIALHLFNSPISLNSMLGMMILAGISVNNSIIFVDFYKRMLKTGLSSTKAIIASARQRFRAIIVTNLTTIAGLVPLAIGFGSGGKILQPLGISVIFGLAVSTFFTMVCVPVLLNIFTERAALPNLESAIASN